MSIVRSLSVGEGDMFYIIHNNDTFSIIDCCMEEVYQEMITGVLKAEASKSVVSRFISTHPDDDHIRGLTYLNKEFPIRNFYCVKNEATKPDESDDFDEYCKLRDDTQKAFCIYQGCSRAWLNEKNEERSGSGINVLWPVVEDKDYKEELNEAKKGTRWNNISPIIKYSVAEGVTIIWMGDLLAPFMEKIQDKVSFGPADILFAPHHGRDKVPDKWLAEMKPKVIILGVAPSTELVYYKGYNMITQNSADHITIDCLQKKSMFYVTAKEYSVAFLTNEHAPDSIYGRYIGSLVL